MDNCLHCRLMTVIDDWRSENPDEPEAEIFERLAETMGNMLALIENPTQTEIKEGLQTMCEVVFESFVAYRTADAIAEAGPAEPRGSLH
jgi:hypothetical protein